MVLEPVEKRERKLVIEWPEKEKLLAERKQYLNEHAEKAFAIFKKEYPPGSEVTARYMARLYLDATFMMGVMQTISPLPFESSIDCKVVTQDKSGMVLSANVSTDQTNPNQIKLIKGVISIYVNKLQELVYGSDDYRAVVTEANCYVDDARRIDGWSKGFIESHGKETAELDILVMSLAVHEFAHLLYIQERIKNNSKKRINGLDENYWYQMVRSPEYLSLDIEMRARVWERDFLKQYFPDSGRYHTMKKELDYGEKYRKEKLAKKKKGV